MIFHLSRWLKKFRLQDCIAALIPDHFFDEDYLEEERCLMAYGFPSLCTFLYFLMMCAWCLFMVWVYKVIYYNLPWITAIRLPPQPREVRASHISPWDTEEPFNMLDIQIKEYLPKKIDDNEYGMEASDEEMPTERPIWAEEGFRDRWSKGAPTWERKGHNRKHHGHVHGHQSRIDSQEYYDEGDERDRDSDPDYPFEPDERYDDYYEERPHWMKAYFQKKKLARRRKYIEYLRKRKHKHNETYSTNNTEMHQNTTQSLPLKADNILKSNDTKLTSMNKVPMNVALKHSQSSGQTTRDVEITNANVNAKSEQNSLKYEFQKPAMSTDRSIQYIIRNSQEGLQSRNVKKMTMPPVNVQSLGVTNSDHLETSPGKQIAEETTLTKLQQKLVTPTVNMTQDLLNMKAKRKAHFQNRTESLKSNTQSQNDLKIQTSKVENKLNTSISPFSKTPQAQSDMPIKSNAVTQKSTEKPPILANTKR